MSNNKYWLKDIYEVRSEWVPVPMGLESLCQEIFWLRWEATSGFWTKKHIASYVLSESVVPPGPPPMTRCTHSLSYCLSSLEHCPWPYRSPVAQEPYSLIPGQTLVRVWLAWGCGDCKMPALCLKVRQLWCISCSRAPTGSGWHPVQPSPHSSTPQPDLDIRFFQEHPFLPTNHGRWNPCLRLCFQRTGLKQHDDPSPP